MIVKKYNTDQVHPDQYKGADFYEDHDIFDSHKFISTGNSGTFELRTLIFKEKGADKNDAYELGFGKWNPETKKLDDLFETNNEDVDEILATVAGKALEFLKKHPQARIFATGSTPGRTRLYQRQIGKNLDNIPDSLRIQGVSIKTKLGWSDFQKGINYDAFLLSAK
ncbi:hypothetical protein Dfri01_58500 [Dyadobacter frigoris]|uniref:DUF6934 family protein n=1 Tax=Dyadobacter frigoris TaxID=2576211 RepID=UPI0024A5C0F1|nr:hypothetical protein [Dyadobacter frigoris]GLU56389.1 hypothetical protein Dfri01_58500 [Dyadobacter frigoris]